MSEETLATIEAPVQRIREMVEKSALVGRGDPYYPELYFNIQNEQVNVLSVIQGEVVSSYCTYSEPYFDAIESEQDEGTQVVISVPRFLSYLDFASDGGDVQLAFRGDDDAELASAIEIYGALNVRLMLAVGKDALKKVPMPLVECFDGENRFNGKSGTLDCDIVTEADVVQRLIEVVEYDPETPFFPITVTDGEFSLDIGRDAGRDAVWGDLSASDVDVTDDFQNYYEEGFKEVFDTLTGEVTLQTAPSAPLCVLQTSERGVVIRHVLGNIPE